MGDTRRLLQRVRVDAPHRHGGTMWCRATIWADASTSPSRWWGHLATNGRLRVHEAKTRKRLVASLEAEWAELAWSDAGLPGGCPHCRLEHDRVHLRRAREPGMVRVLRKRVRALEAAAVAWDARHRRMAAAVESAAA